MKVVLCNCSPAEAHGLARQVVEEGLAACVNVLPGVTSFYVWDGQMQEEHETTLIAKVSLARAEPLVRRLRELHSYDTPEIVVLEVDVARSDREYVAWVRSHR